MGLSSLIGLALEKRKAHVIIQVCLKTGETFPHTLIHGVGGCGKTALARAIGEELEYHFIETHAAPFKRNEALFDALTAASKQSKKRNRHLLFFIDEIHRLSLPLQEALYSAMKEWWLPTAEGRQDVRPFTLFGATTRLDMLDENSFVKRFENNWEIRRYSVDDLAIIIADVLSKSQLQFGSEVSLMIAKRCLGIPRTAVTLANKVRHVAIAEQALYVTSYHVAQTFDMEEIDILGLNPTHHRYLSILNASYVDGGHVPLGIGAIAAKMRQHEDGIKGSIEPILMELDMVAPTPRGRKITDEGVEHLRKTGLINNSKK